MENNQTSNKDIDSTIIELTSILNELTDNAAELSQDILNGINAYQQLAIAWFAIAFIITLTVQRFGGWTMINIGIVIAVCFILESLIFTRR
jgi:hypothetical protein